MTIRFVPYPPLTSNTSTVSTTECASCGRLYERVLTEAAVEQFIDAVCGSTIPGIGYICPPCWALEKEWDRVRIVDEVPTSLADRPSADARPDLPPEYTR